MKLINRWSSLVLVLLLVGLQYPLWLGRGGYLQVRNAKAQLDAQEVVNSKLTQRNAGMAAEVRDLKNGLEAVEERARSELGLVKSDEIFVQVPDR